MTRVFVVRHGQTDWNVAGRIQGSTDIALNAEGTRQAERLAERLSHERIDVIYSSDLKRAWATALPNVIGTRPAIVPAPALRERRHGVFEGLTRSELDVRYKTEYARWTAREPNFSVAGAEAIEEFSDRAVAEVIRIAAMNLNRPILLVTHGGVLDAIYRYAMNIPAQQLRDWPLGNAMVNELEVVGDIFSLRTWGDDAHL